MKGEWSVGTVAWYLKATNAWFWDYSLSNAERRGDARKFAREESESDHIERIGKSSILHVIYEKVVNEKLVHTINNIAVFFMIELKLPLQLACLILKNVATWLKLLVFGTNIVIDKSC